MAATDPAGALLAAFTRIAATRMAGLPMNNPALSVAAVGFRAWEEGTLVGVLVTPWAINLVLVAAPGGRELYLAPDRRETWAFPSGDYDFMGGDESECGAFQFCSLFSPAFEFDSQAAAEAMARDVMDALFVAAANDAPDGRELARLEGRSVAQIPTTRRGFLRGVMGGLSGGLSGGKSG